MQLVFQNGSEAGKIIELNQPVLVIGRQAGADLILADSQVSRRHVQIQVQGGNVTVMDLGSANGSFVNGQPLPPNVAVPFRLGDSLKLGDTVVRLQEPVMPASPPMQQNPVNTGYAPNSAPQAYNAPPQQPQYNNYQPQGYNQSQAYSAPQPAYNPQPAPNYNAPSAPPVPATPRRGGSGGLIIGIIIALLLVGGGIAAVVLLGGNTTTTVTTNTGRTPTTNDIPTAPPAPTSAPGRTGSSALPPAPPARPSIVRQLNLPDFGVNDKFWVVYAQG
jgi:pSer/pThr/pTyr-binding forkhead associated (FHA) protein